MINILFVCTGNTCRSPMAEAILKSYQLEGVEVKSAGVYAQSGEPASRHVLTLLDKNQIPHQHSSTLLTPEELGWATYILTMTESHKRLIAAHHPQAIEKMYTLKEFVDENKAADRDISDPYGGDESIYSRTYEELSVLIEKLVKKLQD